ATAEKIRAAGSQDVDTIQADLSSIEQTRAAAAAYLSRHDRLDVLLNNAGAVFADRHDSIDGIEMTLALNHLSYFIMTNELTDLLKQTAAQHGEARIVNVSSEAHRSGMNWDDIQYEKAWSNMGFGAYGQSKCMNILHAVELAQRLEGTGVTANALHPGLVATGFGRNNGCFSNVLVNILQVFAKSPAQGAETSIYLASSAAVGGITGKYFADSREKEPIPAAVSSENATRLWAYTERLLSEKAAS
ncbi:MAG: SDR family NAD(P)-dependent oxidoreductase, partial [Chloroflexota bacterium]